MLEGLETKAREARKGLWADPQLVPPWMYRKPRCGQSLDISDIPLAAGIEGTASSCDPPGVDTLQSVSFPSVWVLTQLGRSDRLSPLRIHELANVDGGIFWARGLLALCSTVLM